MSSMVRLYQGMDTRLCVVIASWSHGGTYAGSTGFPEMLTVAHMNHGQSSLQADHIGSSTFIETVF